MPRYRKVHVTIWIDNKTRGLSYPQPNGHTCFMHLLTTPMTSAIPGLFRAFPGALAAELRWSEKAYLEAFREAFAEGLVKADWSAGLVWVPNAVRYDKPASPNVVRSWSKVWEELPDCEIKLEAYHSLKAFLEGLGKAFAEAFAEAFERPLAKACPNPDPRSQIPDSRGGGGNSFRTAPPPKSDLPPPVIVTDSEQQTIHSLRDYHAKLHKLTPRGFIEGDDLQRIALVLREYGGDGCQKIIRTHHERCKVDKKTRRSFLSAFPHVAGDKRTPNWDWISELTSGTEKEKAIEDW
jgi:hypothetical protein